MGDGKKPAKPDFRAALSRLDKQLETSAEQTPRDTLLRWSWLFQRVENCEIAPGVDLLTADRVATLIRDYHLADPYEKSESIKEFGDDAAEGAQILHDIQNRHVDMAPEPALIHVSQIMREAAGAAGDEPINPLLHQLAALTALFEAVSKAQIWHVAHLMGHPQVTRREIADILGIHPNNLQRWLARRGIPAEELNGVSPANLPFS
ncbi:MerR family transcriptional regulator [Mycobacteroides abscessus]|uniref:hypothetical protein n=1 Tax=Mycobacteroides abscessus TaxID=36809 RepID=UPI00078E3A9F|nr:hypothetical protein [Mycobacteroides abscessus]AMU64506.1 hypothetical protein A3O04_03845 [Mycobacteroides abscessus]MBE5406078.1 hypothetical protein [Mycobacteroides abscessus]MBE5429208.1 hypothetical protein [Mycobacteroides abscessus]MBE5498254.1 hypothetical protein [Mycobacteroides abscessus]MBN7424570.1 hypothetical protein [Mycobacteroides abscessus subsp. massiliense]